MFWGRCQFKMKPNHGLSWTPPACFPAPPHLKQLFSLSGLIKAIQFRWDGAENIWDIQSKMSPIQPLIHRCLLPPSDGGGCTTLVISTVKEFIRHAFCFQTTLISKPFWVIKRWSSLFLVQTDLLTDPSVFLCLFSAPAGCGVGTPSVCFASDFAVKYNNAVIVDLFKINGNVRRWNFNYSFSRFPSSQMLPCSVIDSFCSH